MGRISRIPEAVVELMLSNTTRDCWTIEELQQSLNSSGIAADFSSVFRASQKLEEQGIVHRVELNDGKSHFEITHGHHDHLICQKCQLVSEIPCEFFENSISEALFQTGFKVISHSLVIEGLCKNCQESGSRV